MKEAESRLSEPAEIPSRPSFRRAGRSEAIGLGLLFGTTYFIQGISEPTEGLVAQPVRSWLMSWGKTTEEIGWFCGLMSLPWSFKLLYGLLSDFVPIGGSRRRSYLILTTLATVIGFGFIYWHPPAQGREAVLLLALIVPTIGVAFSDVVIDALMVERGQPLGMTGRLQSIQWAAMYSATAMTGFVGGWLSQHDRQELGFLICATATAVSLIIVICAVREPAHPAPAQDLRGALKSLVDALRDKRLLVVAAFIFIWNFNPSGNPVQHTYLIREANLSEQSVGNLISFFAVAAVAASVAYGFYCRRVPFAWLVQAAIVTGIVATVGYVGLIGPKSAMAVTLIAGFTYMTGNLIQFDLAARVCPPHVAGTVFAMLMAISNFSLLASSVVGGSMFDRLSARWGMHVAFDVLVVVGALCTAGCWLVVPSVEQPEVGSRADFPA